jgi:hypothetical protein
LTLLASLELDIFQGDLQVVLADYLVEPLGLVFLHWGKLACFTTIAVTELNLLLRLGWLLPTATVIRLVKVDKEERM